MQLVSHIMAVHVAYRDSHPAYRLASGRTEVRIAALANCPKQAPQNAANLRDVEYPAIGASLRNKLRRYRKAVKVDKSM